MFQHRNHEEVLSKRKMRRAEKKHSTGEPKTREEKTKSMMSGLSLGAAETNEPKRRHDDLVPIRKQSTDDVVHQRRSELRENVIDDDQVDEVINDEPAGVVITPRSLCSPDETNISFVQMTSSSGASLKAFDDDIVEEDTTNDGDAATTDDVEVSEKSFRQGQLFVNYDDFMVIFNNYCHQTWTHYTIRSSLLFHNRKGEEGDRYFMPEMAGRPCNANIQWIHHGEAQKTWKRNQGYKQDFACPELSLGTQN